MSAAKQGGDWPILRPPVDHGAGGGTLFPAGDALYRGLAQPTLGGGGDSRQPPTHASPEPRSSRSAMASKSVKGRVRTTRKPTECNVCLRTDPQAEVHDTTSPPGVPKLHNHEEGGSLGAYTPELGGQDRHLGSKEQWPDEGPSPVYSKRIAICAHGGVRRRILPGAAGSGRYTSQRILIRDRGFCGARSQSERARRVWQEL